jgi:hypothetical protein
MVFNPNDKEDIVRICLFVIFSVTFLQPLYVSIKGYLKLKDIAWFMHPIFCFCIMSIYSYAVVEKWTKNQFVK